MGIYTRKGDSGMTATLAGKRIGKHDLLIEIVGRIDELQTAIDRVLAQLPESFAADRERLTTVQRCLWQLAGELSQQGEGGLITEPVTAAHTEALEEWIDSFDLKLDAFVRFTDLAAIDACEARVRTRSLERALAAYAQGETVRPEVVRFVNRLSDYCFALSVGLERSD